MIGGSDSSPSSLVMSRRTEILNSDSEISADLFRSCANQKHGRVIGRIGRLTLDFIGKDTVKDFALFSLLFFPHLEEMLIIYLPLKDLTSTFKEQLDLTNVGFCAKRRDKLGPDHFASRQKSSPRFYLGARNVSQAKDVPQTWTIYHRTSPDILSQCLLRQLPNLHWQEQSENPFQCTSKQARNPRSS